MQLKRVLFVVLAILVGISLILSLLNAFNVFGREKTAYIDNTKLLQGLTIYQVADEKVKTKITEYDERKTSLEDQLKKLQAQIEYNPSDQELTQTYTQVVEEYQQFLSEAEETVNAYEQEQMTGVYDIINTKIQEYGRKHGYTYIYGATVYGSLVYAKDGLEITDKMIEYINASD